MFKKFTALFLITAITNAYAVTPVQQSKALATELNKTFDALNYKLNVEWNQKDSQFFDATIADFEKEIADLQKEGVSTKDLMDYTTGKIKDKEIQKDIQEMSKIIAENQMSNEEARAFVVSKLSSTYSHGASWSGSRVGVHAAVIVGIIILILVCAHSSKDEPKRDDGRDHNYPPHDGCEYPSFSSYNQCEYDFVTSNNCCQVY